MGLVIYFELIAKRLAQMPLYLYNGFCRMQQRSLKSQLSLASHGTQKRQGFSTSPNEDQLIIDGRERKDLTQETKIGYNILYTPANEDHLIHDGRVKKILI